MTATTKPPPLSANAVSFASIVPGVAAYTYIGCYQETANDTAANDVRALAGGTMNTSKSMTVADCISFCGNSKYAGLESGKECRCAPTLNPQSMKMPDSNCTALCMGDRSEVCGGLLLLTTYQRNASMDNSTSDGVDAKGVEKLLWAVMSLLTMTFIL
ncbi:hypothetical protein ABVK25_004040 [Lepraria finkii]|uniref:WSC domain-containing protein n=1 Tax=Lepraria finkii TaxID=1340010 RepID=A0ABR4BD62_9LECA